jgi:peroxiredoxin
MRNQLHNYILLFCILGLFTGCQKSSHRLKLDKTAADFKLMNLDHGRFYLNQQRGKVVLLLFWTTWCNICKEEMLYLNDLQNQCNTDNFVIKAICADPENIDKVRDIASRFKVAYSILLDQNSSVTRRYKILAFPTTILIDPSQKIQFLREGYTPLIAKQLKIKIQSILSIKEGLS